MTRTAHIESYVHTVIMLATRQASGRGLTGCLLAPRTTNSAATWSATLVMTSAMALAGASRVSMDRCIWCFTPLASKIGSTLRHRVSPAYLGYLASQSFCCWACSCMPTPRHLFMGSNTMATNGLHRDLDK